MEQSMLYAAKERIEQEVQTILNGFGDIGTGHVFNLSHGIHPDVTLSMPVTLLMPYTV